MDTLSDIKSSLHKRNWVKWCPFTTCWFQTLRLCLPLIWKWYGSGCLLMTPFVFYVRSKSGRQESKWQLLSFSSPFHQVLFDQSLRDNGEEESIRLRCRILASDIGFCVGHNPCWYVGRLSEGRALSRRPGGSLRGGDKNKPTTILYMLRQLAEAVGSLLLHIDKSSRRSGLYN